MKYSQFERLVLAVGVVAIGGTILATYPHFVLEEVVAQLLLLIVLVGAVHWGRRGGFVAAVFAIIVYLAMRAPLLVSEGLTPDLLYLVIVRTVAYGVVGILGGEVCGRIKYFLASLQSTENLDGETRLYNQAYLARIIASNLGIQSRYKAPFAVVLITLSPALTSELRPSRRHSLLRATANHIRNDVRLVDDVGRLEDGTFAVILPQTPKSGAEVAATRVTAGLRDLLGAREESVSARVLGAPEDMTELTSLCDSLERPPAAA